VSDRDDSLRPEPKDWVNQDDGHHQGEADKAGAEDIDDQRLGEHVSGVRRSEGVDSGKCGGDVKPGVE